MLLATEAQFHALLHSKMCACNALAKNSHPHLHVYVVFGQRVKEKVENSAAKLNNNKNLLD